MAALLFAATLCAPAWAIPGQTTAQLAAWGKANVALHGFKPTIDQETGGTNFMASIIVDGYRGEYSAEPENDRVHMEYISFQNFPDARNLAQHLPLVIHAIGAIYGQAYVDDFRSAARMPHNGRVTLWQGKKLGYATFGPALFFYQSKDVPAIAKNMRACDALDCSDND